MYVAHVKSGWSRQHVYIGKETAYRKGSPLANPFRLYSLSKANVAQNLRDYRRWLFTRLQAGDTAVWQALRNLRPDSVLVDYVPSHASHGHVVRNAWIWGVRQGWIDPAPYEQVQTIVVPVPEKSEAKIAETPAPVIVPVAPVRAATMGKEARRANSAKQRRDLAQAAQTLALIGAA